MDNLQTLNCRTTPLQWNCINLNSLRKTQNPKPLKPPTLFTPLSFSLQCHPVAAAPLKCSAKHASLLVESYHRNSRLKFLIDNLSKRGSNPLQILRDDGDWSKEEFWAVVRFLLQDSRSAEVLQVFGLWMDMENSRINELNYYKIIRLLSEEGLMGEAVSALQEMKEHGLRPSFDIYNCVIHGFARTGKFDDASFFLNEMKEANLTPDAKTYEGLIEAYGKYRMYDEIGFCLKKMELGGCKPDHVTYNLLIKEFSRGGLLKRMEKMYKSMLSKRIYVQSSTLVAVLEAYANFGILEKMEKVYRKAMNLKIPLKEDLIRKMATVYIENYMFSRLDDLGYNLSMVNGKTKLVWCLRLLSHACLLSRKGMDSIVERMGVEKVPWNITTANTILLAYLKMKDLKHLKCLLLESPIRHVKPDLVTLGILWDAKGIGFHGTAVVRTWRRTGLLDEAAEINTDPLVMSAFGKGQFLRSCEEMYCSLKVGVRESKTWSYQMLINSVSKHNEQQKTVNVR